MFRNASVQVFLALMTLVPNRRHLGNLQNDRSGGSRALTLKSLAEAGGRHLWDRAVGVHLPGTCTEEKR